MKNYIFTISFLFLYTLGYTQTFDIDTIIYHGNTDDLINIVFLGDGYTEAEQGKYVSDVTDMSLYLFKKEPFKNYEEYFNVFAIKVISPESGVSHPNNASDCDATNPRVPEMSVINYFGTQFDNYNIHRLIWPTSQGKIAQVLAANFPNYDQAVVLGNTGYYGGSGGHIICLPAHSSAGEILAHEMGHSFAALSDEYWAGDVYAGESANMTAETDPEKVKWKNWMGTNSTGIFPYGSSGNAANWYRPHQNCEMQYLNRQFCSVCKQTIVERIHNIVYPIRDYYPIKYTIDTTALILDFKLTDLLKPHPNTFKINWILNGEVIASNVDSIEIDQSILNRGNNSLTMSLEDTTTLLRIDDHENIHTYFLYWNIIKTTVGTEIINADYRLEMELYPNPASDIINFALLSDQTIDGIVTLASANGGVVKTFPYRNIAGSSVTEKINISDLSPGIYFLNFKNKDVLLTKQIVIK